MTPTSTPQQYNPVIDMNNGDRCPIQATVSYNNDGKEIYDLHVHVYMIVMVPKIMTIFQ